MSANSMSMGLRHAATLALVGWYLMYPPIVTGKDRVDSVNNNAPFSEWERGGRIFKSREKCEAFGEREREEAKKPPKQIIGSLQARRLQFLPLMKTMCVRSDDPRLKEK